VGSAIWSILREAALRSTLALADILVKIDLSGELKLSIVIFSFHACFYNVPCI